MLSVGWEGERLGFGWGTKGVSIVTRMSYFLKKDLK